MQKENVSKICRSVTNFLKERTKDIGKIQGFTQRKSKLNAEIFAQTLVMGAYMDSQISLESMRQFAKYRGVKITKQGLHKRFTAKASGLMENLLQESFCQFRSTHLGGIDLLKSFSGVYLLDSSGISLPESMKDLYQGFGGGASEAGLKLQVLLNYVDSQIEALTVTAGRKNDQGYRDHLANLQAGALYLQDLGYFSLASFKCMQESGAYFISRYLPQTRVFDENHEPLDFLERQQPLLRRYGWGKNGKRGLVFG